MDHSAALVPPASRQNTNSTKSTNSNPTPPASSLYSSTTTLNTISSRTSSTLRASTGTTTSSTTASTLGNYHPLPPVTPPNPRSEWLRRELPIILSLVFQVTHLILVSLSLTTQWSTTKVTFHGNIVPKPVDLYPSTFWTNYDNFVDSGAVVLGVLMMLAGLVQPAMKALAALYHTLRRPGYNVTTLSLMTAKYTMVSSNVGVVLLSAVTLTFDLGRSTADAITDTEFGTTACLIATLVSVLACYFLLPPPLPLKPAATADGHGTPRTSGLRSSDVSHRRRLRRIAAVLLPFLTTLLLIPSLSLPLVKFTFSGLAAPLLDIESRSVTLFTLGTNLWSFTPSKSSAFLFCTAYWMGNMACPFLAFLTATFYRSRPSAPLGRAVAFFASQSMQDCVALALVVVSAQVGLVSSWIFDDSVEICEEMQDDIGEECLIVEGEWGQGMPYLIAACICWNIHVGWVVFDWSRSEEFKLVAARERDEIVKATMGERQKRENMRVEEERRRRGEAQKILEGVDGVDAPLLGRGSTEEEYQKFFREGGKADQQV